MLLAQIPVRRPGRVRRRAADQQRAAPARDEPARGEQDGAQRAGRAAEPEEHGQPAGAHRPRAQPPLLEALLRTPKEVLDAARAAAGKAKGQQAATAGPELHSFEEYRSAINLGLGVENTRAADVAAGTLPSTIAGAGTFEGLEAARGHYNEYCECGGLLGCYSCLKKILFEVAASHHTQRPLQ